VFPARFFNVRYFAARFWAKVGGAGTWTAPAASRLRVLEAGTRRRAFLAQSRVRVIAAETRIKAVTT
jgi:hypothetical protein